MLKCFFTDRDYDVIAYLLNIWNIYGNAYVRVLTFLYVFCDFV